MTETTTGGAAPRIRRALPEEAGLLTELALRSKGHWGYTQEFLAACRAELTVSPEIISSSAVFVLEDGGRVVGFYGLREQGDELDLLYLFVEPSEIRSGRGRLLWEHAVKTASVLGFRSISIESDPAAEGFYRAVGARRVGVVPSNVLEGRVLPLLKFHLR